MFGLILILPFLNSVLLGFFCRLLGRRSCSIINIFIITITWILSLFIFFEIVIYQSTVHIGLYSWIILDISNIELGLLFDALSCSMVFIICTISWSVHIYSLSYMSHDPYLPRFLSFLSLFTFFMLILVTSNNLLQLFVGWEGVGLCSYLLINFWFTRIAANKAAFKAMLMNRIADAFFIIGILILYTSLKTVDYTIIFNLIPQFTNDYINFITLQWSKISLIVIFLTIGAWGKSAQIGFHTWLADAMEGPTPVSALLHAATMVTAGVFLVSRCNIIYQYTTIGPLLLIVLGSVTAVFAGICALGQYDIKKIIAYSTCSQLGYMFLITGVGEPQLGIGHLLYHAFFKASLFLLAGAVIHSMFDEQDMRRISALWRTFFFIHLCFMISTFALIALPGFTGFYSKDAILEFTYARCFINGYFIYTISILAAILTTIYSTKLLYQIFMVNHFMLWKHQGGFKNGYRISLERSTWFHRPLKSFTEIDWFMLVPLLILSILSLIGGYILSDLVLGIGSTTWINSFFLYPLGVEPIIIETVPGIIKMLPFILSLYCMCQTMALIQAQYSWTLFPDVHKFLTFLNSPIIRFYQIIINTYLYYLPNLFNILYNKLFLSFIEYMYTIYSKSLDKGYLEYIGPFGVYLLFKSIHSYYKSWMYVVIAFTIFSIILFIVIYIIYSVIINIMQLCILSAIYYVGLDILIIIFFIEHIIQTKNK